MTRSNALSLAVVPAVAIGLAVLVPGPLAAEQRATLAVVALVVGFWSTEALPAYLTTLILFAALLVPGLAPPDVVFSGFASSAMWLALSGFVIGAAVRATGLGEAFAAGTAPLLTRSYPVLVFGLVAVGAALGFVMPSSTGRAMVLVPLAIALSEAVGLPQGSSGRTGIVVAVALAATLPSFAILTANLPNIVLAGASERILDVEIGYAEYLALHYPVLGLAKGLAIAGLVLVLFPARIAVADRGPRVAAAGEGRPASGSGRLAVILLATLVLWSTDQWHGTNAAWIGLAAAVLLLLPRVGLVDQKDFRASVDVGTLLLIAGVLALGAVADAGGLGRLVADLLAEPLPLVPGETFRNFMVLSLLAVLVSLVTTVAGAPAVLTPLAPDLAAASGLALETVLMTQVIGFSTVILPYQAAPLVIAMGLAGEPVGPLLRTLLALAALTLVLLLPLAFAWWRALGWL